LTSTHPDVTTSDHKFEHECEFDSFTEVDWISMKRDADFGVWCNV
jgi:hypothetical protein